MLDIQREKIEIHARLKAEGMDDHEIKRRLTNDFRPFTPAFINGKRVERDSVNGDEPSPKISTTETRKLEPLKGRLINIRGSKKFVL